MCIDYSSRNEHHTQLKVSLPSFLVYDDDGDDCEGKIFSSGTTFEIQSLMHQLFNEGITRSGSYIGIGYFKENL